GDEKADQPDDDDGQAVAVQHLDPRLAQEDQAKDHRPLRDRLVVFRVRLAEGHLRIAPKDMPRSRWFRSRKVKTATGSRNRKAPAAIAVQSCKPEPTWYGM